MGVLGRATLIAVLLVGSASAATRVIVVDPGHGGEQEGAKGPGGELEKTLALQIARKVRSKLESELNAKVFLTRDSDADVGLSDRVTLANKRKPDLFVSIHANSMPTRRQRAEVHGLETYFLSTSASGADAAKVAARENADGPQGHQGPGNDTLAYILADLTRSGAHADSSRLAHAVHARAVKGTEALDRGVHQAPFFVLTGVEAPAILVECGYISHPEESRKLKDPAYQDKIAQAIVEGVRDFFSQVASRERAEELP